MSDYLNMRVNMVNNQLKPFAVTEPSILNAFRDIPRELFSQYMNESNIYSDNLTFLNRKRKYENRYYLSPAVFAKMLQISEIKSTDKVMEIGCLTGYSTAILSKLCSKVYGIDCEEELIELAKENTKKLNLNNVKFIHSTLKDGYPKGAPYNLIFINGSIQYLPDSIIEQVHKDGSIISIENENDLGNVVIYKKSGKYLNKINYFEINVPYISEDFIQKSVFTF